MARAGGSTQSNEIPIADADSVRGSEPAASSGSSVPSGAMGSVAGDITKLAPRRANDRGHGRPTKEVIVEQVTAFRPGNGTTYRNEAAPRIPVEFTPEEAVQVLRVLTTGYASYTHREALMSGRARLEQAVKCEQGPGGVLNEKRAA